jgi:hypothetical protein
MKSRVALLQKTVYKLELVAELHLLELLQHSKALTWMICELLSRNVKF